MTSRRPSTAILLALALTVALTWSNTPVAEAAPADTWTAVDTPDIEGHYEALAYGDGNFVATSCDSNLGREKFLVSTDAVHWTRTSVDVDDPSGCYLDVVYGEGRFVAVSLFSRGIATSADGITWTTQCPDTGVCSDGREWSDITYGNGKFVAVSMIDGDKVLVSDDGVDFQVHEVPDGAGLQWNAVTYGNGRFVAVGWGDAMYSTDGVSWTVTQVDQSSIGLQHVAYGNGVFVALEHGGGDGLPTTGRHAQVSPDGVTWTGINGVPGRDWSDLTFAEGAFVAVGAYGSGDRAMTSTDGVAWSTRLTPADNTWTAVTYGGGAFVAIAGLGTNQRVMTSGTFVSPHPTTTTTTTISSTTTVPVTTTTVVAVPTPPPAAAGGAAPDVAELVALPSGLVAPTQVAPGDSLTVAAPGFLPGETVAVVMRSTPVTLGQVVAGADGHAVATVTIPANASAGAHHLYMFGLTSRTGSQVATQVVVSPLAFTGAPVARTVVLATLLIVAGIGVVQIGGGRPKSRSAGASSSS